MNRCNFCGKPMTMQKWNADNFCSTQCKNEFEKNINAL